MVWLYKGLHDFDFPFMYYCSAVRCPLLGAKRTYAAHKPMSALPPIADICSAIAHVRFVPKADIPAIRSPRRHVRVMTAAQ